MIPTHSRLVVPLALLALAACTAESAPDTSEQDASTIRGMVDEWLAHWNAGDAESLASLYVDDAIGMHPDGPNELGRDAMHQAFVESFGQFLGTQSATVDQVQVAGDVAFVHGTWMVTPDVSAQEGGEEVDGDWLWILSKEPDGQWRIARHISNTTLPQ